MTNAVDLPPDFRLIELVSVGSTSDEAKDQARKGAAHGTFVWAREQTTGRGRAGRTWASPPGNLYVSVVLRPGVPMTRSAELSFVSVVALGEALSSVVAKADRLAFKWPNDVLLGGRKVAGILLETESGADWVVLGVGVNVVSHPADAAFPATDLAADSPAPALRHLLVLFANALDVWMVRWRTQGFAPVRNAWMARAWGQGDPITVRLPDRSLTGRFSDLDAHGRLILALPDGSNKLVAAGDVYFGTTASSR